MIKQYVVLEMDVSDQIVMIWGPFRTEELASEWEAPPTGNVDGSYSIRALFEPPVWEELPAEAKQDNTIPGTFDYGPDIDR